MADYAQTPLNKRLLIRADSSFEIGTGHIVRCLSIAEELRNRGIYIDFWSRNLPGNSNHTLIGSGFKVIGGNSFYLSNLELKHRYSVALVDHYQLDQIHEKEMRAIASKIVVIDDWGTRKHDADLIIDPTNTKESFLRQTINSDTPFLIGYDWIMMRPEFSQYRALAIPRSKIKEVLFFFGGTDPAGLVELYAYECEKRNDWAVQNGVRFNFLISKDHPKMSEFRHFTNNFSTRFHFSPKSVAELMLKMDYYIGSAGSITWERMALGLTGAVITIAENQEGIASTLHDIGLHDSLGACSEVSPSAVFKNLERAAKSPEVLIERSKRCRDLIDGLGSKRLSKEIIARFFSE